MPVVQRHETVQLAAPNRTQVTMSSYRGQQPPTQPGCQGPPTDPPTDPPTNAAQTALRIRADGAVGRLVVTGLGLLGVLVGSFLPYYRVEASYMGYSDTHSTNAWDSWVSMLGVILLLLGCLAAAASELLDGRRRRLALVGGAAAASLTLPCLLVSLFAWPDYSAWKSAVSGTGVHMSQARDVGSYLVLALAVMIAGLSWVRVSWSSRATIENDPG